MRLVRSHSVPTGSSRARRAVLLAVMTGVYAITFAVAWLLVNGAA